MLNQEFLLRVDCKSAKSVLQKDVKNIAFKNIFAKWQAILEFHDKVRQYRKEIKVLRQFIGLGLFDIQEQINRIVNQGNLMDIPESSHINDMGFSVEFGGKVNFTIHCSLFMHEKQCFVSSFWLFKEV